MKKFVFLASMLVAGISSAQLAVNWISPFNGLPGQVPTVSTNGFTVNWWPPSSSPTNLLGLGQSGVTIDGLKPAVVIVTNASFAFLGAVSNMLANTMNQGVVLVTNTTAGTISVTALAPWIVQKRQGLNETSTLIITNGTGCRGIIRWFVVPGVTSNLDWTTGQ